VSKEGGYPTVVWTLMVLHVLRCSVFLTDGAKAHSRALLGAIAAFFDRFAEGGITGGTLLFVGGTQAEFHPAPISAHGFADLSVLDPTTTSEDSRASGIEPAELAPPLPAATRLLHAYELRRAQVLAHSALAAQVEGNSNGYPDQGGAALRLLFAEAGEAPNTLPVAVPSQPTAVLLYWHGCVMLGLLKQIEPKPGWSAPFLHRRDNQSALAAELFDVEPTTGTMLPYCDQPPQTYWFAPCDVVSMASLRARKVDNRDASPVVLQLDDESLERWLGMRELLEAQAEAHAKQQQAYRSQRNRKKPVKRRLPRP